MKKVIFNIKETALGDMKALIREFKKVNAKFDFARFSFDCNGKYQFYNAPYGNEKQWQESDSEQERNGRVLNTCIDLEETFVVVLKMLIFLGDLLNALIF